MDNKYINDNIVDMLIDGTVDSTLIDNTVDNILIDNTMGNALIYNSVGSILTDNIVGYIYWLTDSIDIWQTLLSYFIFAELISVYLNIHTL